MSITSRAELTDAAVTAANRPDSALRRVWASWTVLLERREHATTLALCRIGVGLTLLHGLGRMWLSGAGQAVWVDVSDGGVLALAQPWLPWFHAGTRVETTWVVATAALGALLTTFGLGTRLGLFLAWLGARTLSRSISIGPATSDIVLFNLLLPLMCSDSGRALSLDALIFKRSPIVSAWPRYLLIGQMTLMYWASGVQKISSGWVPGGSLDAVWYIMQWTHWVKQPFDMSAVAPWYWLTRVLTLGTWLLENSAPVLLLAFWFRYTRARPGRIRAFFNRIDVRSLYVVAALLMHLGIWYLLEVGEFLGYCTAYALCCYTPDEWRGAFSRLRAAARR